jgi:hypothetical protein
MHGLEGLGYWLWGIGTVLLAVVFAWSYAARNGTGREETKADRRPR